MPEQHFVVKEVAASVTRHAKFGKHSKLHALLVEPTQHVDYSPGIRRSVGHLYRGDTGGDSEKSVAHI